MTEPFRTTIGTQTETQTEEVCDRCGINPVKFSHLIQGRDEDAPPGGGAAPRLCQRCSIGAMSGTGWSAAEGDPVDDPRAKRCAYCRSPMVPTPGKRSRQTCSDRCRVALSRAKAREN